MENKRDRITASRGVFVLAALFAAACLAVAFSISSGAVSISLGDIWKYLFQGYDGSLKDVVWNIRLPRTLVAALVGVNLACSGAILQGVMRNPLADPHIIGVSSGAGLFGIIVLILFPHMTRLLTPVAFIGATGASALIYVLAWKQGISPVRIILAGVAVSAFLGSGISALLVFYSDRVHGALMFLVGGLSAKSWPQLYTILPYSLTGALLAMAGSTHMNVLSLGDSNARGLGLRVETTRFVMTAVATLLAASAVSVVGLLGFVGLIVPHTARLMIGGDYRLLIPATALLGIAVVTFCDTVARLMFAPVELPVGIIMGVLGAPFFLFLLRREAG
ncbi:Petrobactin import system permease protein FpuB [Paenibacillus solanacearum]|uniref:Petrobactin import system permease protein FpuB n=1 Tax=Paenibacillus solanacearum TaxID=2048548 RepID=A0A916K6S0_9BACL|nr:iron ABC transporter permease [Paenibacillus solanacearum]CAG7648315.1 Petrobactin import system permease protein FpuB [Paenibacillus solanacearum]